VTRSAVPGPAVRRSTGRWPTGTRSAGRRPDRARSGGSVSILFAIGMTMVLLIIGLSVDGGGQIREARRATDLAAEAARAGGQQIDIAAAIGGDPTVLDPELASAAALSYLDGMAARAGVRYAARQVTFSDDDHVIHVSVTIRYQTVLLDALPVGALDSLDATGSATATPILSP